MKVNSGKRGKYIKSCETLIGRRFGKLTVENKTDKRDLSGGIIWKCKCDCGNITYASTSSLNKGHKKSCGCLQREKARDIMHITMKKYNTYNLNNELGSKI